MTSRIAPGARHSTRWRRRFFLLGQRRLLAALEWLTLGTLLGIAIATWAFVTRSGDQAKLMTPPMVALLLIANLVPAMALMVLIARRVAIRRAVDSGIGRGGRLHVRLVALFSIIAAVPTLLVVIFASLLFQYSNEFWFSDRARAVLENADRVTQAYVDESKQRLALESRTMAFDLRNALREAQIGDPRISTYFAQQVAFRLLDQAAIISVGGDKVMRLVIGANLDPRPLEARVPVAALPMLQQGSERVTTEAGDRVEAVVLLDRRAQLYLYVARVANPLVLRQAAAAQTALGDYNRLLDRSRALQLRFNLALFLVSLLIVGVAIVVALSVADRLVRPVADLVGAARRVGGGDLSARVSIGRAAGEVGALAAAFNRMTRRLEEQTGALVSANAEAESRRTLIEAVFEGVTAGVVSVDSDGMVRTINRSAEALLGCDTAVGRPLHDLAPELEAALAGRERETVVQIVREGEPRTIAVRSVHAEDRLVITLDDITQQLADQRRAAWSDVARRIAHEIKNPLTPIQLAAERLQRRYGKEITSDPATFERLTQTVVRQVGDLRRMVDEFSAFARMPKPQFRPEPIADVARQVLFLHEVAHPRVRFLLDAPDPSPILVSDRRQLGQALTNIVKNAVEAIEAKPEPAGQVAMRIVLEGGEGSPRRLVIDTSDDGIGLPAERDRLTEPYMTTRARGTGLGLAIVKRIVEEHGGTIAFADRAGGGTLVRLSFDPDALAPLAEAASAEREDDASLPELTRMKGA
ncbi:sensor histidine kinase [Sphingomonas jatrophae]|uniref:histidine kinase n=1 Tax=Sphingomonas jatrophae TaxID=1166337 RepID=A0A1I6JP02_9SPHN|nr:ATP-binding protein [Sphingomonas jatrophae]SFR80698.1 two-component system, NtrC family, nitrogen regulation sensor histidine kinase NtrY [Sphingomonas jatrophae]